MSRNELDFPNEGRLADFTLNLGTLLSILPEGWVFAGVMRQAGVEYGVVQNDQRWFAVATLEDSKALGPIPEIHGSGKDMVGAVADLRTSVMEQLDIEDPTAAF